MTNFEINNAFETADCGRYGELYWEDADIENAFECMDCYDYSEEDFAAIRAYCMSKDFLEAMTQAGWELIYAAIERRVYTKEAIDRRAREEGLA